MKMKIVLSNKDELKVVIENTILENLFSDRRAAMSKDMVGIMKGVRE